MFIAVNAVKAAVAMPEQVHGNKVEIISKTPRIGNRLIVFKKTDGIITNLKGVLLTIRTADCLPVFLIESKKRYIGLIHAGFKGTQSRITEKAVLLMLNKLGCESKNITAAIGPSIGPCCYPHDLWEENRKHLNPCP